MFKPIGSAKRAYERGTRDRKAGKKQEDNPYLIFGYSDNGKAAWWSTGWKEEDKRRVNTN